MHRRQKTALARRAAEGAAISLITFFGGVASASAEDRYASPTGSGAACSSAAPCTFTQATTGLSVGDRVILKPGTYAVNSTLMIAGWELRGESTTDKPLITSTASTTMLMGPTDSVITDVRIQQTSASPGRAIYAAGNTTVSRVDVTSNTTACELRDFALLRDSICRGGSGSQEGGIVVYAGSGVTDVDVRNVTAAGVNAIYAGTFNSGVNVNLDVRNSILRGSTDDISAENNASISNLTVTLASSNYDSIDNFNSSVTAVNSGTNQAAAPSFVDEAGGDFHPRVDSPTVNAGTADPLNGPTDLDGRARDSGGGIDIGAYEYAPSAPPAGDTTPPETTIDKGPKKKTKSKQATFTFSSSEAGSTFVCKVDKKAEAPCTSPLKLKKLKKGKHTLTVVATDAAGNADATAASYKWKVAKKKPKRKG